MCIVTRSAVGTFTIGFLLSFFGPGDDKVPLHRSFGSRESIRLDTVIHGLAMHSGVPDDLVFEQDLEGLWMARLDKVFVMFQYEFDFAIRQRPLAYKLSDAVRHGDLRAIMNLSPSEAWHPDLPWRDGSKP